MWNIYKFCKRKGDIFKFCGNRGNIEYASLARSMDTSAPIGFTRHATGNGGTSQIGCPPQHPKPQLIWLGTSNSWPIATLLLMKVKVNSPHFGKHALEVWTENVF